MPEPNEPQTSPDAGKPTSGGSSSLFSAGEKIEPINVADEIKNSFLEVKLQPLMAPWNGARRKPGCQAAPGKKPCSFRFPGPNRPVLEIHGVTDSPEHVLNEQAFRMSAAE